ncbi:helix-turn-helix domain-containing protein [Streptomyces sp. NPDC004111]|uniref:helix-turn-helix domain-containing protein n=1 Tax=Streptomyces sp. NPDC004111 TaxID=3364690 RepID=UPI0036C23896
METGVSALPDDPVPFDRPLRRTDLNPTAAGVVLGSALRELREERDLSVTRAAKSISVSTSKLSRLERAENPPIARDVSALADLYRVRAEQRHYLTHLAKRALEPEWFDRYEDFAGSWMRRLMGLESDSLTLWTNEVNLVPGLLQTEEYTRELMGNGLYAYAGDQLEHRIELRMERQRRFFDQAEPPQANFLLDASILDRCPGTKQTRKKQLRHLLTMTDRPGVSIRFIPLETNLVTAVGSMTCLQFSPGGPLDMVYIEGHDGATYKTKKEDVELHLQLMFRLSNEAAESTDLSRSRIQSAINH